MDRPVFLPPKNYRMYRYVSQQDTLLFPAQDSWGRFDVLQTSCFASSYNATLGRGRAEGEDVFLVWFCWFISDLIILVAFAVVIVPTVWGILPPWEKDSKLSLFFRTHRPFPSQIRTISRAPCSHRPCIPI